VNNAARAWTHGARNVLLRRCAARRVATSISLATANARLSAASALRRLAQKYLYPLQHHWERWRDGTDG